MNVRRPDQRGSWSHAALAACALLAAPAGPASAAPADRADRKEPTPAGLRDVGVEEQRGEMLPLATVLADEQGRKTTLGSFFTGERPVVIVLVYFECPMLCTLTLNGTLEALQGLRREHDWLAGREFTVLTVSFVPDEGPELARAKQANYLAQYDAPGAAAGWRFLTGDAANLRALTDAVGFRYRWNEERKEWAHVAGLFLCTPDGVQSRFVSGVQFAPKTLRLALVEAGDGKVGTTFDQFLLTCFHFDPEAGVYTLAAVAVMRAAGLVTLLALGVLFWVLWRRRKHVPRKAEG